MGTRRTDVAARLTAETSAFDRGVARAGTSVRGLAGKVEMSARRMRTALRNTGMGNVAARFRGLGTSIAAFAGAYVMGRAIHAIRQFEDSLEDIRRFGRKDQEWMVGARKQMLSISDSTGVAKEGLAEFLAKWVEMTGEAQTGLTMLKQMAKVSVATGASMTDLAQVVELLGGTFGIKGAENLSNVMGKMAKQAIMGKMSFKDIASTMGQVGALAAAQLGITGEKGVTDVGAILQLGRRVAPSADITKTSALRFIQALSQKYEEFEKISGVSLRETGPGGKEQFKNLGAMTKIVAKALAEATPEQMKEYTKKVFQEVRARNITAAITQAYKAGWGKRQGEWVAPEKLIAAKGTEGGVSVLGKMYGEKMESSGHKIRKAMVQISNEIHRTLLPVFLDLAKALPRVVPWLRSIIANFRELVVVFAAIKIGKFINAMRAAQVATGGKIPGIGGMTTATMNVTAATVNVLGGKGGPGVVPAASTAAKTGAGAAAGVAGGRAASWWTSLKTGMGARGPLGLTPLTLALMAPFFDWSSGQTSPEFEKRKRASDKKQREDWTPSIFEQSPLTSWMYVGPGGPPIASEIGLGGVKPDVKEPDYGTMAQTIASAVERAIQNATVKATVATTAAERVAAKSNSTATR